MYQLAVFFLSFILCTLVSISNAAVIGKLQAKDASGVLKTVTYERQGRFAVSEGDIIVAELGSREHAQAMIIPKIDGGRWPDGVLPFEISEDLPIANKIAVLQAISHWQDKTHVAFIELNSKNRQNYPDHVLFERAFGTTCSSFVGRIGGTQVVNLSPRCTAMITVHEVGHALGLWHEQSRADRDNYIRILWDNIEDSHKFNFEQHLSDGRDFGEYDYQSIMHYASNVFSKNGQPTIVPIAEDVEIGQRRSVSPKDVAAINAMYPSI